MFPRRDDRTRPPVSMQSPPVTADDADSTKQEEVTIGLASPNSWNSKPPPLFQEGAPYPPPLFIRDTYNQALPQPMPRKIKRPKRRYRYEEPTSIMNAIKLRPRQVLCDKCKGVVASGGHREARRGPVELRAEEASRRRRPPEAPIPSELKRLRNDDKAARTTTDRRSSSSIRVASSSTATSSRRVLRGVSSSSSTSSSSRICLKKALAKGSAVDRSKAQQVLKKLSRGSQPSPPHRRPKDQNQKQGPSHKQDQNKAVTRAASMKSHNQKIHFTRRLSGANVSSSSHTPLPPRVRLKPQRYRTDDSQVSCSSSLPPTKQSTHTSPPKPVLDPDPSPPTNTDTPTPATPSPVAPPPPEDSTFADDVSTETEEVAHEDGAKQIEGGDQGQVLNPSHSCSQDSCNSEWSSGENFDAPHEVPTSSSLSPQIPPSSASVSSLGPRCPSVSAPSTPASKAEGKEVQVVGEEEEEEEGVELKRRRKSSTSSSSSSSSSSSVFSKLVSKCLLPDGRTVCVGDIVWAKIYGFPWWPARVLGITVSRRGDTGLAVRQEARVSWFGSPTTSFLPLTQLSPFLESFQSRFDRKRKGPYRRAISEAASAAKQLTPEVRALLTQFET